MKGELHVINYQYFYKYDQNIVSSTGQPARSSPKQTSSSPLCDELEAGLAQAQTYGGKLMEAVVHHLLAG